MKTYLSVGIGDMMCFDTLMTQSERESITEIYWGCRFGKDIAPIIDHNIFYKIRKHHFIEDKIGADNMKKTYKYNPTKDLFWHYRPDIEPDYTIGKELLKINSNNIYPIDAVKMVLDTNRTYQGSSFLMSANPYDIKWSHIDIKPFNYILMHYPTSTRPRTDIATIDDEDWNFINKLSNKTGLKVAIISDIPIQPPLNNYLILNKISMIEIIAFSKYADYYVGCDSFCAILSSKVLPPHKLFIKTHDQKIHERLPTYTWIKKYFLPHHYTAIQQFYTPKLKQREI